VALQRHKNLISNNSFFYKSTGRHYPNIVKLTKGMVLKKQKTNYSSVLEQCSVTPFQFTFPIRVVLLSLLFLPLTPTLYFISIPVSSFLNTFHVLETLNWLSCFKTFKLSQQFQPSSQTFIHPCIISIQL